MKSFVYHFQINVSDKRVSFPFYKELLGLLEYKVIFEKGVVLGMGNGTTDLWLIETPNEFKKNGFHRKNTGLNHISFGVETKELVDEFVEKFVKPNKLTPLYKSAREFSEYEKGYYAVYFEDPDRVKIEVTYKPKFKDRKFF